jgi:O-antigen/teichoic acid export membrane protein
VTFARNVSITLVTRISILLVGLVTSVIMARTLGPEGKGLFALAVLVPGMVFAATNLGLGTASGYLLGRKKASFEELSGYWLSLSFLIGFAAFVISLVLAPVLAPRLVPSVPLVAIAVALGCVPFMNLAFNFQMLFRASNDFRNFNLIEALQPAVFFVLFTAAAIGASSRLFGASIVAFLVSNIAGGLGAVFLASRISPLTFRWNGPLVKEALGFGLQQNLANLLNLLNYRFDMLLVNFFLDPKYVGFYSISVVIAEKLWYLPNILSAVLHPRVAHAGSEAEANKDTARVSRITVLLMGVGGVSIALLGRPLVRILFSDRFLPAVVPLFVLLPGILMISIAKVLTSDLIARGYPRANMWAGTVGFVSNVILNIFLIPRMALVGAALSSTVSYTLYAVVILIFFLRITGMRIASLVIPTVADIRLLRDQARRYVTWKRGVANGAP